MLKHVVMVKLKSSIEGNEKTNKLQKLKSMLDGLPASIPEIKHLETGINVSESPAAYDLVLITDFENGQDLDVYRKHSKHQEVLRFINDIKENIVVVDY